MVSPCLVTRSLLNSVNGISATYSKQKIQKKGYERIFPGLKNVKSIYFCAICVIYELNLWKQLLFIDWKYTIFTVWITIHKFFGFKLSSSLAFWWSKSKICNKKKLCELMRKMNVIIIISCSVLFINFRVWNIIFLGITKFKIDARVSFCV